MSEANLFGGRETTKEVILQILAESWPLTVRKIYSEVKNKSGKIVTYQAVYKSVKELLSGGVLSRQENGYLISPVWLEKTGEFVSKLSVAYGENGLGVKRKIQELNFASWSEGWDFLFSKINTAFFGESKEAYIQIRRFFWMPISKDDINKLKAFASKIKVHIMCRGNSPMDKMVARFLTSLGAHVYTGVECAHPTSVFVYGGSVISFYVVGERERATLSEYYNQTKDMMPPKSGVFSSFNNLLFKELKLKLVINRDPDVLSDVIEQTKAILKKTH
ncbi:hypothetical protein HYU16_04945 [Candidatus Woesearchaeota archaeon]|nr:hypothetical protein [Candidatus Woesearchaeota archaeon]